MRVAVQKRNFVVLALTAQMAEMLLISFVNNILTNWSNVEITEIPGSSIYDRQCNALQRKINCLIEK